MPKFRLSEKAKEDLRRIYEYGVVEFGVTQVDEYFYSFFEAFERISQSPLSYQSIDHIIIGYGRCPHRCDVIYYRINQDWVDIMAMLGGQDLDAWL